MLNRSVNEEIILKITTILTLLIVIPLTLFYIFQFLFIIASYVSILLEESGNNRTYELLLTPIVIGFSTIPTSICFLYILLIYKYLRKGLDNNLIFLFFYFTSILAYVMMFLLTQNLKALPFVFIPNYLDQLTSGSIVVYSSVIPIAVLLLLSIYILIKKAMKRN